MNDLHIGRTELTKEARKAPGIAGAFFGCPALVSSVRLSFWGKDTPRGHMLQEKSQGRFRMTGGFFRNA